MGGGFVGASYVHWQVDQRWKALCVLDIRILLSTSVFDRSAAKFCARKQICDRHYFIRAHHYANSRRGQSRTAGKWSLHKWTLPRRCTFRCFRRIRGPQAERVIQQYATNMAEANQGSKEPNDWILFEPCLQNTSACRLSSTISDISMNF